MAELKIDFAKMAEGFTKTAKEKGMFVGWWIPVGERMPKWGEEVLTINNDGNYEINHIIDDECNEWFYDNDIVAWMLLPEPYKSESEK